MLTENWNHQDVVSHLRHNLPGLLAIYVFGSMASGEANRDSDLDLAVLIAGYADPVTLFNIAGQLSDLVDGRDVDLVDLRAASTVMQYQILAHGYRLWERDSQAALYEAAVLSEKTALDETRKGIISDIISRGSVYDG